MIEDEVDEGIIARISPGIKRIVKRKRVERTDLIVLGRTGADEVQMFRTECPCM